jgi:hypothetical protein
VCIVKCYKNLIPKSPQKRDHDNGVRGKDNTIANYEFCVKRARVAVIVKVACVWSCDVSLLNLAQSECVCVCVRARARARAQKLQLNCASVNCHSMFLPASPHWLTHVKNSKRLYLFRSEEAVEWRCPAVPALAVCSCQYFYHQTGTRERERAREFVSSVCDAVCACKCVISQRKCISPSNRLSLAAELCPSVVAAPVWLVDRQHWRSADRKWRCG